MACDKHIMLAVLIITVTVIIVVINIRLLTEKAEPKKFLILTDEQIRSNALKRKNEMKRILKLDKSHKTVTKTVSPKNHHQVRYLDVVELEIYPYSWQTIIENQVENSEVKQFKAYLKKFNKSYSPREWNRRFENFKQSLRELSWQGQSPTGARHGPTKFSDWSKEEFAKVMNNTSYRNYGGCTFRNMPCPPLNIIENEYHVQSFNADSFVSYLPDIKSKSLDWRQNGTVIGPVLDQKQCNGCWAFGIVGLIESMTVISNIEPYVRRSIQELIDCSIETEGCRSGHVSSALHFLCVNDVGLETEDQYPIILVKGVCKYRTGNDLRKVKEFWTNCYMNESDILRQLQLGPVIAVINAEPLKNYIDGIIQRHCYRSKDSYTIDHVVQIVGYNLDNPIPYYIVKNSWGSDWGEDGYFKLEFGKNLCGISDEVTYLNVK